MNVAATGGSGLETDENLAKKPRPNEVDRCCCVLSVVCLPTSQYYTLSRLYLHNIATLLLIIHKLSRRDRT